MVAKKKGNHIEGKRSSSTHRTPAQIRKQTTGFNKTPEEKRKRALRMKARRVAEKAGKVKKNDGQELNHKKALSRGGSNSANNIEVVAQSKNRAHGLTKGNGRAKKKKSKPTKRKK